MSAIVKPVVSGMLSYLQSNLATYVNEIEASESVTVPDVAYWGSRYNEPLNYVAYPACIIVPDEKRRLDDEHIYTIRLDVMLIHVSKAGTVAGNDAAADNLMYLQDALSACVLADRSIGGIALECLEELTDFYMSADGGKFMSRTRFALDIDNTDI